MSVILTEPVYICDLCERRPLVYHSTSQSTGQTWGTGIHLRGRIKGVQGENLSEGHLSADNLPNTKKHLCSYCLADLKRIAENYDARFGLPR